MWYHACFYNTSKFKRSQYKTNVMHFSFNLMRIKGLYMDRALLAHPQEALHKRHLVYCVRIMSVAVLWHGCSETATVPQPTVIFCEAPPEDEQVMLETCRGLWFSINWMKSASRWFQYTDILWCTVSKTLSLRERSVLCPAPNGVTSEKLLTFINTARTSKLEKWMSTGRKNYK
jgi:hypothetical protein